MKKVYTFYSDLSPDDFLTAAKSSVKNTEYLLKDLPGGFSLGVLRGGHSGGYWYDGQFSEECGKLKISGTIVYKDAYLNTVIRRKDAHPNTTIRRIEEYLLFASLFVLFFYILIPLFIIQYIKKKKRKGKIEEEERLEHFMIDIMKCNIQ